jgi:hypothetical protein
VWKSFRSERKRGGASAAALSRSGGPSDALSKSSGTVNRFYGSKMMTNVVCVGPEGAFAAAAAAVAAEGCRFDSVGDCVFSVFVRFSFDRSRSADDGKQYRASDCGGDDRRRRRRRSVARSALLRSFALSFVVCFGCFHERLCLGARDSLRAVERASRRRDVDDSEANEREADMLVCIALCGVFSLMLLSFCRIRARNADGEATHGDIRCAHEPAARRS